MRIAYYENEYLEECAALLQNVYNNEQWGCNWSDIKAKKYIEYTWKPKWIVGFLLLTDEEELIGAALCHERTWWYKDELFIDEFFIAPSSRQRGYGSKLLNYMTKYTKEQKLAGLTLTTNNLIVADFYHKNKSLNNKLRLLFQIVILSTTHQKLVNTISVIEWSDYSTFLTNLLMAIPILILVARFSFLTS